MSVGVLEVARLETRKHVDPYFDLPGLSSSGMKDLAVSPLRYWHLHINPSRPVDEPTTAMQIGSALHCAVLEPHKFDALYCCDPRIEDHPGCLVTMDDLRDWLKDHGLPTSGKTKADLIDRVMKADHKVPIWEVVRLIHEDRNAGKVSFTHDDYLRIAGAAESLRNEPRVNEILGDGQAEVALFAKDHETGVLLKAKLDWMTPKATLDLKTFTQMRGKSIDRSVNDAIFYERYFIQAYFYDLVRRLAAGEKHGSTDFVMAFVESEAPHETRIKALRPKIGGEVNIYWERARIEVRSLIRLYTECIDTFGDRPWRYTQEINALRDEEMPGIVFDR